VRGRRAKIVFAAAIVLAAWLGIKLLTWPDVGALAQEEPRTTAFIERYKEEKERNGKKPGVRWRWVPESAISGHLKRAVVVSEDIEFFSHEGFSEKEIRAAIEKAIQERKMPRGASTITQQLAKNLWLSPSRNPFRKIEEAILTRQLERELTKGRILELYLNVVELGPGIYGAEAASQAYFGKSAADLSAREAAELAAALPRPSKWHPGSGSRSYNRRIARVEKMSQRAGFLRKWVGGGIEEELAMPSNDERPDSLSMDPMQTEATADSTQRMQELLLELKRDLEILREEEDGNGAENGDAGGTSDEE
jgi:monofunctional biosynthetic peptidoglycan transglycosylase